MTVHLVFRRLHPWEVCGRQESQRAARFPGWREERTRASPWVSDGGTLWVHEQSCSSVINGWINLWSIFVHSRDLSMILCDPFACNTLVLSIMRNLQELLSQDALPRVSYCAQATGNKLHRHTDGVVAFYWVTAGAVKASSVASREKEEDTEQDNMDGHNVVILPEVRRWFVCLCKDLKLRRCLLLSEIFNPWWHKPEIFASVKPKPTKA